MQVCQGPTFPAFLATCRSRGRHGTKYTEEMEDQALLADEDTGGERAGHRLSVQPSVIKGGQMRKYQMEGLNWLIHLYDNGINGILADEMVSPAFCQTVSSGDNFGRLYGPCASCSVTSTAMSTF